jgi:hypothetical protein
MYVSKLMFKYGRDLNLNTNPKAGEKVFKGLSKCLKNQF